MKPEVKSALITGLLGIVAVIITGIFGYISGGNSTKSEMVHSINVINENTNINENSSLGDVLNTLNDEIQALKEENKILKQDSSVNAVNNIQYNDDNTEKQNERDGNDELITILYDVPVYGNNGMYEKIIDNFGNEHSYAHLISPDSNGVGIMSFNVNGNYSAIKGKIVLGEAEKSKISKSYINIYGDEEILFTSEKISEGIEPISFDIDITGITTISIELQGYIPLYIADTGLYQ